MARPGPNGGPKRGGVRTGPGRLCRAFVGPRGVVRQSVKAAKGSRGPGIVQMASDQNPVGEGRGPVTVVLADDEQLIRGALAQALSVGGLELVGEAADVQDASGMVLDLRPDVVLMDLMPSGGSGVDAIAQLSLLAPASRVLVLTRSEQNRVVEAI